MKRMMILLLCLTLAAGTGSPVRAAAEGKKKPLRVVTTIFPVYDWTREVADGAEDVEVVWLMNSGVDLHSFQPGAKEIMKVASCDVFIFIGGESDEWIRDALKEAVNPDLKALNLMEALGEDAKEEERTEGMQEEAEPEGTDGEKDEHIWLSLKNAEKLTSAIAGVLVAADPERAGLYEANAEAYIRKLEELDGRYRAVVEAAPRKTVLFGDRFPFRYLTDDYGLDYYAAFSGCSAETEASFETIIFLASKTDEANLPAVLMLEGSSPRIAETVIENTREKGRKILVMNSMQGVTEADAHNGVTYLGIMEENLETLKQALGD